MGRRPAGEPGTDLAALARAWLEGSCAAQGVPVKLVDRKVLAASAELLCQARGAGGLGAPDGFEAGGVEAVVATAARLDDQVIHHCGNDGLLAGQG